MARKPTAADLLALDLQRQLAALNAQPSPVKVVENIINPPAVATYKQQLADYEKAKSQFSEIKDPLVRATLEGLAKSADTQTTRVATMADALGYQVNPNTGVVEPKPFVPPSITPTPTPTPTPLSTTPTLDTKKVDAIAAISALLSSYGLGDLSGAVTEAVQKGYTSDTIQLIMQDPNSKDPLAVAFQTRFSGNKARFAAGKAVLSPGEYLAAERSYTQVLQSYGVASLATKDKLSSFISNDISAAEVADRVGLAIDRVRNADPFVKAALAEYYPTLNQADIVSAVLDPAEGLPALKRKIQIGEIGGAAAIQGLKTGLASTSGMAAGFENVTSGALGAEALASFGITQEEARKGYQTVASIAPRAEFLSSISTGEDYTRLQAEQEAFLGLASAKRARESISAQEEGRFKGQSGLTKTTLTQSGAGQY
jgi:hypothetical protein